MPFFWMASCIDSSSRSPRSRRIRYSSAICPPPKLSAARQGRTSHSQKNAILMIGSLPESVYRSAGQDLERVRPLVSQETRNAPQHAKGLDRPRSNDPATIEGLPTKLSDDLRYLLLGSFVISAEEHGRRALLELWIDHAYVADAVESFDHVRQGDQRLKFFPQRFIGAREILQDAVDRRGIGYRIGRVNHRLAGEVFGLGQFDDFICNSSQHGEDYHVAEARGLGESSRRSARRLGDPLLNLFALRVAGTHYDLMAVLQKPGRQHLADNSRSQYSNFHVSILS